MPPQVWTEIDPAPYSERRLHRYRGVLYGVENTGAICKLNTSNMTWDILQGPQLADVYGHVNGLIGNTVFFVAPNNTRAVNLDTKAVTQVTSIPTVQYGCACNNK